LSHVEEYLDNMACRELVSTDDVLLYIY